MFFLTRWIQKRRQARELIKEAEASERIKATEARELTKEAEASERIKGIEARELIKEKEARETERRIQQEKRDYQQTQALLLTLHELRRTMDPLIAAQVYNNRFCPFTRLPEELLLCVLDFLSDNDVALKCLRIVSRTFFRLIDRLLGVFGCIPFRPGNYDSTLQFHELLQRDGRCDNCRRWNDSHRDPPLDIIIECKFQQNLRFHGHQDPLPLYRRLYCYACHSLHDVCQFSSTYQWGHQPERRCLGQQGSVQLCEHVQISWASIKAHIDDSRQRQQQQQRGGDFQECLDSFNIECHESSHDMRCTASEAPTWPRARLRTSERDPDIVVLHLEWIPHCRIDALIADEQIPALELRALFRRLRRLGPADILYPCHPEALPEMACASQMEPFIYYKTGEDRKNGPPIKSFLTSPSRPWLRLYAKYGRGRNGRKLEIKPHYLRGCSSHRDLSNHKYLDIRKELPQCLVVCYEKDVMVCETTAITDPTVKIIPTDHWLHAMDTRTYPHPQARRIRPQCLDETCNNYYRRRKDYYLCPTWPVAYEV